MLTLRRDRLQYIFEGPKEATDVVKASLTLFNPKTGFPARLYRKTSFDHGHLETVSDALRAAQIDFKVEGGISYPTENLRLSEAFLVPKRRYQRRAILNWMGKRNGIMKLSTRAGKTFMAAECLRHLVREQPTIKICFLTENASIFEQNLEEVPKILGEECGRIQGQTRDIRRVTFAMAQTLQSGLRQPGGGTIKRVLESFDCLVVDEMHLFTSAQRLGVIRAFRGARFTMGLSATPMKKSDPVGGAKVRGLLGPIIEEVPEAELRGTVLAEDKIVFLRCPPDRRRLPWPDNYTRNVVEGARRNGYIVDVVGGLRALGLRTIVFVEKKDHGRILSEALGCPFVYGETDPGERADLKEEFLKGGGGVLVASRVFSIGVSFPTVHVLVNAAGFKEETAAQQRRGRVLGASGGKTRSMTIDFLDEDGSHLEKHSRSRARAYSEQSGGLKIRRLDLSVPGKLDAFLSYVAKWFGC